MIRDSDGKKSYTLQDLRDMQKQAREARQALQKQFTELRAEADDFKRSEFRTSSGWQQLTSWPQPYLPPLPTPPPPPLTGPLWKAMERGDPLPENCTVEYDSQGQASIVMRVGGGGVRGAVGNAPGGGGGGGGGATYRGFGFGMAGPLPQFPATFPSMVARTWLPGAADPGPAPTPQPKGRFNNLDWPEDPPPALEFFE